MERAVAALVCALAVGTVLTGCVIIPPPLAPFPRTGAGAPSNPLAAPAPRKLALDPISVTLRNGVPVVHLCEDATIVLATLSESLIADDPSKGYVDVWVAEGTARLKKGDEFEVGAAPKGLTPTTHGAQKFDFTDDYWTLELDDFGAGRPLEIIQKFRAQALAEGIWLDLDGRPTPGPCDLGD
jgi:hypothetical protein